MPNICANHMKLGRDEEVARRVLEMLKDRGFNAFIPEPAGADNDWRLQNWGDKWDIDREDSEFDLDRLRVSFTTAWQPPTKWFIHVAERLPTLSLELHYVESGNRLWGWLKSESGILTEARETPILDGDNCEEDRLMEERAWEWFDWTAPL